MSRYYKVLREINGKLYSAVSTWCTTQYPLDEIVQPKIGKLFIFADLAASIRFAKSNSVSRKGSHAWVFEVDPQNPVASPRSIPSPSKAGEGRAKMRWYWETYATKPARLIYEESFGLRSTFEYTYFCDSLRLLKPVNILSYRSYFIEADTPSQTALDRIGYKGEL